MRSEIGNAVVEADLIDVVGSAITVEIESLVRTAAKVANVVSTLESAAGGTNGEK